MRMKMEDILGMFDTKLMQLPAHSIERLQRPVPDKVLTEVTIDGTWTLVPSTSALGIVLRFNLTKKPTFDELKQMAELMLRRARQQGRQWRWLSSKFRSAKF